MATLEKSAQVHANLRLKDLPIQTKDILIMDIQDSLIQKLLNDWQISQPILIGKYKAITGKPFGFFNEVKTCDGRTINYPDQLGIVKDIYIHSNSLEEGVYYRFYLYLAFLGERERKHNEYLIQCDIKKDIVKIESPINQYQKIIDKLFKETGTTAKDAGTISRSLKNIAGDLYTESERFIFEILQNADDFPSHSGIVKIHFILLQEHLLIVHDGKPFGEREVQAISDIGDSTKDDLSQTRSVER